MPQVLGFFQLICVQLYLRISIFHPQRLCQRFIHCPCWLLQCFWCLDAASVAADITDCTTKMVSASGTARIARVTGTTTMGGAEGYRELQSQVPPPVPGLSDSCLPLLQKRKEVHRCLCDLGCQNPLSLLLSSLWLWVSL